MKTSLLVLIFLRFVCVCFGVLASEESKIDSQIAETKKSMVELGAEVKALEKLLLYRMQSQLSVYLSMDAGQLFSMESVKLILDDQEILTEQYGSRERLGFQNGAAQLLYHGSLSAGVHELIAVFSGRGIRNRPLKRGLTYKIDKQDDQKILEIVVRDDVSKQRPMFMIREID